MLRTSGDPSQCGEEAGKRVSFDSPKYSTLRFLIVGIFVRDGFRCMVTGMYDYRSLDWSTGVRQEVRDSNVAASAATKSVLVVPQSIAMKPGVDAKVPKVRFSDLSSVTINHAYLQHEFATSIWPIMSYFGFEGLSENLVGNGIHTLENVFTLSAGFRILFEC